MEPVKWQCAQITRRSVAIGAPAGFILRARECPRQPITRDLARNEEFSEIAVINIFFTVLKTKTQLSVGGGVLRGKFRDKSRN